VSDNYLNKENNVFLDTPEAGLWMDVYSSYTGAATLCEQTLTPSIPSNSHFVSGANVIKLFTAVSYKFL
jgi:hypothetical protein